MAYRAGFETTGRIGPVAFFQTRTLPAKLSFTNGVLSGTPTQTGSLLITIWVKDMNGCAGLRSCMLGGDWFVSTLAGWSKPRAASQA